MLEQSVSDLQEECDHRTKVEEAKRQELSLKFQSSIGEITNQMQDNHSKNQQLKTDNAEYVSVTVTVSRSVFFISVSWLILWYKIWLVGWLVD